ncbi:MAG: hypothetical protein IJ190_10220 [Prevotella sp.]|nr:hypothetical protein [Prevotella sp.]
MKKLFLMGFVALAFASCVSDKEVTPLTQEQKYEAAFEELVGGQINASVNWGFVNVQATAFDADGKYIGMRDANVNGNEWANYMEVPAALTETQKAVVRDWFQTHPNYEGASVNWSEFWVEQVYKGGTNPTEACPEAYTAGNGSTGIIGSAHMDKLTCGTGDEHINNFNYGDNKNWNGFTLMQNSSSECFGYITSESSEQKDDKYIIVSGDEIDESVAGMYFVGFDFESTGNEPNQQIAADGYYSDWIVRIVPGLYKNRQRVMVEDLIATDLSQIDKSDWDFNDAIFDVNFIDAYENNTNVKYAVITLWAAGGTKSLTIEGKEVHELFGQATSKMINTNASNGIDGLTPVIFRVYLGSTDYSKEYNANLITVKVGGTVLDAPEGKAPQKIVVSSNTKWMQERVIITEGYAKFAEYAKTNAPADWYKTVTDASKLY